MRALKALLTILLAVLTLAAGIFTVIVAAGGTALGGFLQRVLGKHKGVVRMRKPPPSMTPDDVIEVSATEVRPDPVPR